MRTRFPAIVALSVVAILAVACSGGSGGSSGAALPGTSWKVISVAGTQADVSSPPTITFGADGTVSGTTGCNTYNGSYKLDGASIKVGPLAMTLMMCDGPAGALEPAFAAALQGATGWTIGADGNLTLSGAGDIVAAPSTK
jgi:heat shock protein HslJ